MSEIRGTVAEKCKIQETQKMLFKRGTEEKVLMVLMDPVNLLISLHLINVHTPYPLQKHEHGGSPSPSSSLPHTGRCHCLQTGPCTGAAEPLPSASHDSTAARRPASSS